MDVQEKSKDKSDMMACNVDINIPICYNFQLLICNGIK